MKILSIKNTIVIEHPLAEQHSQVDIQKYQNLREIQLNSQRIINISNKMKKTAMTPTPLYIILFSFFYNK